MDELKRRILIVERDPVVGCKLAAAFLCSGYYAQVTDKVVEAAEMVRAGNNSERPFELALVDISDQDNFGLVNDLQYISGALPVLAIRGASDKTLIIDLLNRRQPEFLEHFIETHVKSFKPSCSKWDVSIC